jgi:inner membrane protein
MMSRAGLNRWCAYSTPVLLMSANVPDIDFASLAGSDLLVLDWHRGPTHALAFVALMAALPLLPLRLFAGKRIAWLKAYAVSILGVLSHLFLDWTNIFGVRLLEPFSRTYYHLDTTGVTDLWMLGVMAAAAAWFGISKLVSSEIGSRKSTGRGVAIAVLLFVCFWQTGRYFAHERAVAVLDARIYDGETPRHVSALPHFASPLHWTGVVETDLAHHVFEISLASGQFDPGAGEVFYKPEPSQAIETAKGTDTFKRFLRFCQFPLWRAVPAEEPEGATRVQAMDPRFGIPGEERFVATAVIAADGSVLQDWFQFDPPGGGPRFR